MLPGMKIGSWISAGMPLILLCCGVAGGAGQATGGGAGQESFRLQLPVDEVVLTFHATDVLGQPVNDLKQSEVRLLDNGVAPRRVVAFDRFAERPLHAAILLDTSDSMQRFLALNKAIAQRFVTKDFRAGIDQGLVMDFGYGSEIAQTSTADPALVARGIADAPRGNMNAPGGTALYSVIFRACFYEIGQTDSAATGNVIVLLSDGENTAGQTAIEEAIRACERSNTMIYAFRPRSGHHFSTGPKALAELTQKTGGQMFVADASADEIESDLKTIESETRNQYRIVYAPAGFKHDGSFHRIELQLPDRVKRFQVRTGYYAPVQ